VAEIRAIPSALCYSIYGGLHKMQLHATYTLRDRFGPHAAAAASFCGGVLSLSEFLQTSTLIYFIVDCIDTSAPGPCPMHW